MAVRHVFLWRVGQGNDPDQIVELLTYSQHPYHAEVVGQVVPLMSDRAVVDFELGGA